MITNTKLAKEFKTLLASANKAKSLAEQELEKIDAKYRALAEKEKADLNKTVKLLDAQIASYTAVIGDEEEPAIVDTVFPENNETVREETPAENPVEETVQETEQPTEVTEMLTSPIEEEAEQPAEFETDPEALDWSGSNSDSDEWPEMAEEWK